MHKLYQLPYVVFYFFANNSLSFAGETFAIFFATSTDCNPEVVGSRPSRATLKIKDLRFSQVLDF